MRAFPGTHSLPTQRLKRSLYGSRNCVEVCRFDEVRGLYRCDMCHTGSRPRRELGVWLGLDEPAGKVTAEVTVPHSYCPSSETLTACGRLELLERRPPPPKFEILELFGSNWTNETPTVTAAPPLGAVNEEPPSIA